MKKRPLSGKAGCVWLSVHFLYLSATVLGSLPCPTILKSRKPDSLEF